MSHLDRNLKCYIFTEDDKTDLFEISLTGVALISCEQLTKVEQTWDQMIEHMRAQLNSEEKEGAMSKERAALRLHNDRNHGQTETH